MILFGLVHFLSQFALTNCRETLFFNYQEWQNLEESWSPGKGTARAMEDRSCEMGWDTHVLSGPLRSFTCQVGVKVKWPQRGPPALTLFRPWVALGLVMWLKTAGRAHRHTDTQTHTHTQWHTSVTRTRKNQSIFSNGTLVPIREIILLIRITEKWTWLKMKARWSSTKHRIAQRRVCAILHKIKEQIP